MILLSKFPHVEISSVSCKEKNTNDLTVNHPTRKHKQQMDDTSAKINKMDED